MVTDSNTKTARTPVILPRDPEGSVDTSTDEVHETQGTGLGQLVLEGGFQTTEEEFAELQRQLAAELEPEPSDTAERGLVPRVPFFKGIEDHSLPDGYLPKLRRLVEQEEA